MAPTYYPTTNECYCNPVCANRHCPAGNVSVYANIWRSCLCAPNCNAQIQCLVSGRPIYNFETLQCECQQMPVPDCKNQIRCPLRDQPFYSFETRKCQCQQVGFANGQKSKRDAIKTLSEFNSSQGSGSVLGFTGTLTPTATNPVSTPICQNLTCPLGGIPAYNSLLSACICPNPPCQPLPCPSDSLTGYINGQCTCTNPCSGQICEDGGVPIFNNATKTCLSPANGAKQNSTAKLQSGTHAIGVIQPFLPPPAPKQDITPALIQQATNEDPETTAVVSGLVPHFHDGHISYLVQLNGFADSFVMNASTTIPASTIGSDSSVGLVLVPKSIKGKPSMRMQETVLIIAVNFFQKEIVTYYCQLDNGTVVKLNSDKKVHAIDRMDPNGPPDLSLIPKSISNVLQRDIIDSIIPATTIEKRPEAVQPSSCDLECPIHQIPATADATCACRGIIHPERRVTGQLSRRRGVEGVSAYTAVQTEKSCKAMICINNGDKPAMFNPFTKSCYCSTLAIEELDSSIRGTNTLTEEVV